MAHRLSWPPNSMPDSLDTVVISDSWISEATLVCKGVCDLEATKTDVTERVLEYAGPNSDFFGTDFDVGWIFPGLVDNHVYESSFLVIETTDGHEYSINIATNEESNGMDDDLFMKHKLKLAFRELVGDDFTLMEE